MTKDDRNNIGFEKLEDRICLTVSAVMAEAGMLQVSGIADGTVRIVGNETGFSVTDNGNLIDRFTDVNEINILMDMSRGIANDDVVQVTLNSQSVDRVFAFLGQGENLFQVTGDANVGEIAFVGGFDNDTLNVDATVDQAVVAMLRDGNDVVNLRGDISWLYIDGGAGDDAINASAGMMAGGISARLGNGNDTVSFQGTVHGNAGFMGGNGNDNFTVSDSASIGNKLVMNLGDGENQADIHGTVGDKVTVRSGNGVQDINIDVESIGGNVSVTVGDGIANHVFIGGQIGGDVHINGGRGSDTVGIEATIAGSVIVKLGGGSNALVQDGRIEGDLFVQSRTAEDDFRVLGKVGGDIDLNSSGRTSLTGLAFQYGFVQDPKDAR